MKNILIFIYIIFLICVLCFSYLFIDFNFTYLRFLFTGFMLHHRLETVILYFLLISIAFTFYILCLWQYKKRHFSKKDFILVLTVTVSLLIFAYPAMLSFDIFNYIATAKMTFFYHENPYIIMPINLSNDPILQFTRAANKTALYGPFWIILTGIPYLLSFENYIIALITFKVLIVAFFIGLLYLLWKLKEDIYPLIFIALNPLVIIEICISEHNDVVMMFFALLSLYLLKEKKNLVFSIFCFILSILIKFITIFLTPVIIYIIWKRITKNVVSWNKIYGWCTYIMLVIFLLSPIREEMYPWYAIWFLTFASLMLEKKLILYASIAFSLGLMLRYMPYMFFGTYFGLTPVFRIIATIVPLLITGIFYFLSKKRLVI